MRNTLNVFPTYSLFLYPSMDRKGEGPFCDGIKEEGGGRGGRRVLGGGSYGTCSSSSVFPSSSFPISKAPFFHFLLLLRLLTPGGGLSKHKSGRKREKGKSRHRRRLFSAKRVRSNISTYTLPYAIRQKGFLRSQKSSCRVVHRRVFFLSHAIPSLSSLAILSFLCHKSSIALSARFPLLLFAGGRGNPLSLPFANGHLQQKPQLWMALCFFPANWLPISRCCRDH